MATERSVTVRLRANANQFNQEMLKARSAVSGLRKDIDQTNDRTAWLAQGFLALAPPLVTLGAAAVPILAGIATQATVGAFAIGALTLAFNGIGDGLKALNEYQLEPTAENFAKLQDEMAKLGPDGAEFVRFLDDVGGKLAVLKMDARGGMFPGMTEGIESAMRLLPRMRDLITEISHGLGTLAADAGKGLAGTEMRKFFDYLRSDGQDILVDMGRALGNFVDGFGSMMVAFGPLTAGFSDGFLDMSRSFSDWAEGLSSSSSFQEFVQYVREAGPKALDFFGSLVDALVQLVEAAAPVGAVALPVLTKFLDVVAAIADTPVGSLLILTAALTSMYGRVKALQTITTGGVMGKMTQGFRESGTAAKAAFPSISQWGTAMGSAARSQEQLKRNIMTGSASYQDSSRKALQAKAAVGDFAKASAGAAGAIGLLTLSMSGATESVGLGSTAMGAMVGLMVTGGPWGAALGAGIGLTQDFAAANNDLEAALRAANDAMDSGRIDQMKVALKGLHDQFKDMRSTDGFGDFMSDAMQTLNDAAGGLWANIMGEEHEDQWEKSRRALAELRGEIAITKQLASKGWDSTGMELWLAALGKSDDEARLATMSMADYRREVERLLGVLSKQADFDAVEAAFDAANKAIKENGRTLDENTEKGRANRENLRSIAETALTASTHLKGLARAQYLDTWRDKLVDVATSMGMGEKAAGRMVDRMLGLGQADATPTFDVNDKEGRAKVKRAMREMGLLDGTTANPVVAMAYQQFLRGKITVEQMMKIINSMRANPHVGADTHEAISKINAVINAIIRADGMSATTHITTVFERKNIELADGGEVPGARLPYADKTLIMAAPGEEVISNRFGQADRYRADRDSGRIPRYADGGTIGTHARSPENREMFSPFVMSMNRFDRVVTRSGANFQSALDNSTGSLEKELKIRERMLTKEQQAVQEKISALIQEREAIIASVEARLADIFATDGRTAADFLGDTTGMTSQQIYDQQQIAQQLADSFQQSPTDILQNNIGDLQQLAHFIDQLEALGLDGDALAALIAGGNIGQIQGLISGGSAGVQEYEDLFNQQQHLIQQVGGQAFGATGGLAELQGLRAESREIRQELKELNRRQQHAAHQRDNQLGEQKHTTAATKHVAPDLAKAIKSAARAGHNGRG